MLKNDYIKKLKPSSSFILFYKTEFDKDDLYNASHGTRIKNLTRPVDDAPETSFEDLLHKVGASRDKQAFISVFEYFAPRIKSFLMRSGISPDQSE